jgi:hypothetical protein
MGTGGDLYRSRNSYRYPETHTTPHLPCASKQPSTMVSAPIRRFTSPIPQKYPTTKKQTGKEHRTAYRPRHKSRPSIRPSFSGPPREGLAGGPASHLFDIPGLAGSRESWGQTKDGCGCGVDTHSVVRPHQASISPRERPRPETRGCGNLWDF